MDYVLSELQDAFRCLRYRNLPSPTHHQFCACAIWAL